MEAAIWCPSILLELHLSQVRKSLEHTSKKPSSSLRAMRAQNRRPRQILSAN